MKKKQFKNKINKLLFLELIRFNKTHNKKKTDNSKNNTNTYDFLKQTTFRLKKIFQIIFQYHLNRKKILIIGEKPCSKKKFFYIHKKTKHIYIPKSAWINGLLSNNKTIQKNLKKKNPLLRFIQKPRLIILYNYCNYIDSESYKYRITSVTSLNYTATSNLDLKYLYNLNLTSPIIGSSNLTSIKKNKINFIFSTFIEKIIKLPKFKRKKFWRFKKKKIYYSYHKKHYCSKKKIYYYKIYYKKKRYYKKKKRYYNKYHNNKKHYYYYKEKNQIRQQNNKNNYYNNYNNNKEHYYYHKKKTNDNNRPIQKINHPF